MYGLYTATVPIFVYFLLGSSRQLSTGPMTIPALVLNSSCLAFGYPEATDDYVQIALNITMLSGIISYLVGIFQGGSLVNFLGPSVLSGFLTASAMVYIIPIQAPPTYVPI